MAVKQMEEDAAAAEERREDRGDVRWEERAPPETGEDAGGENIMADAAAAKGSRYKLHGKKSKVDNQPQIKEIHDKCGTIDTCKIDTKLHGGEKLHISRSLMEQWECQY